VELSPLPRQSLGDNKESVHAAKQPQCDNKLDDNEEIVKAAAKPLAVTEAFGKATRGYPSGAAARRGHGKGGVQPCACSCITAGGRATARGRATNQPEQQCRPLGDEEVIVKAVRQPLGDEEIVKAARQPLDDKEDIVETSAQPLYDNRAIVTEAVQPLGDEEIVKKAAL
jgi:hypothetical protein